MVIITAAESKKKKTKLIELKNKKQQAKNKPWNFKSFI